MPYGTRPEDYFERYSSDDQEQFRRLTLDQIKLAAQVEQDRMRRENLSPTRRIGKFVSDCFADLLGI